MKSLALNVAACMTLCAPAMAYVLVEFDEGAPKDRFTVTGLGECMTGPADVTIDLSGSAAGLIFDVTGAGAGVQVFQPFEASASTGALLGATEVRDGDTEVTLRLRDIAMGTAVSFTIDVDDTAGSRQTVVSGSEIAGASVRVSNGQGTYEARFTEDATARVPVDGCMS